MAFTQSIILASVCPVQNDQVFPRKNAVYSKKCMQNCLIREWKRKTNENLDRNLEVRFTGDEFESLTSCLSWFFMMAY